LSIETRFRIERPAFVLDVAGSFPGEGVTAVFGPSGCGKTTLLRAIAGLERDDGGYCRVGDKVWQGEGLFLPTHRRPLGYVFQEPSLFPHLTVRRNLEYGLKRVPAAERRVDLAQAVELLGVKALLNRLPGGLSGGERQRVAIARALLASPRLLLMDEPLAALDRRSKAEILPFLEGLHAELAMPIVYVSHALDEVTRLADHLVLMEEGRIRAAGPVAAMLTRLDLPLAHGDDAEAVVEARVVGHDEEYHLTELEFPGGRIAVSREALPLGHRVRLRFLARDVSLTLERQTGTSILNILPVVVTAVAEETSSQMMVRLDAEGVPLLARVTRKSAETLSLAPGRQVFAQIKSVALVG